MLKNYFTIAWRNIRRHKVSSVINILGLTLGVCACLVIYLIAHYELSYDNFHPDKERIYRVTTVTQFMGQTRYNTAVCLPLAAATRKDLSGLETVAGFCVYITNVTIPRGNQPPLQFEKPEYGVGNSPVILADPQYFELFKYDWLAGNAATALNEPFKVVLTESEAHRYFGSLSLDEIPGKTVIYSDSLRLTVSGIVKDRTENTDFNFRDFISSATIGHSFLKKDLHSDQWASWYYGAQAFVKLAKNTDPRRVSTQFPKFMASHMNPKRAKDIHVGLQPLTDIHFNTDYTDAYSRQVSLPVLYGLMGIAGFILLLAVINFINLSTAQSLRRAKEIGIRKVLGSSRGRLVAQFLCESFLLTLFAVLLAVCLTDPLMRLFHAFMPPGLSFHPSSENVLLFLAALTIVTSLLAGFYPARVLSSYLPVLSLKGQAATQTTGKIILRKSLIVFQFTVSLLFIIGTMAMGRQIHFLLNTDLGFKKDAIIDITTDYTEPAAKRALLAQKIRALPGVSMVSASGNTPAAKGQNGTGMKLSGQDKELESQFLLADDQFLPLYELKLLAGKNLTHSDTPREFLVNETAARSFGFKTPEEAIGKLVNNGWGGQTMPITGVVADFYEQSLHDPIQPVFLFSNAEISYMISARLQTSGKGIDDFKTTLAGIEKCWKEVYPNRTFKYRFFDDVIAQFYDKEQKSAQIIDAAMAVAILISCMGLFGLITFTTEQRTREIGIRKVLGASVSRITVMLCRDFAWLVGIALLIASPLAWYFTNRWLQGFPYRVALNAWIFPLAGLAALSVALATVSIKVIRAAMANPVKSLRSE